MSVVALCKKETAANPEGSEGFNITHWSEFGVRFNSQPLHESQTVLFENLREALREQ